MSANQSASVPTVLFLGAGQHAKLIVHILQQAGTDFEVIGLLDDREALHGEAIDGRRVLGPLAALSEHASSATHFVIGIGNVGNPETMRLRSQLFDDAMTCGLVPISAIHPRCHIDPTVEVGEGSVVHLGACINAFTTVGKNCVIYTNCSIDHDSVLADNVYVSPGVSSGGNLTIHRDAFVGVGASIVQGITIGEGALVGAGAAVTKDVPAHATVVGVPARVQKTNNLA